MGKLIVTQYTDSTGMVYKMRLNQRESDLFQLLLNPMDTLRSFQEMREKLGMTDNLARVTKYSLTGKLPACLDILTVYGKGYFLSESL